MLKRFTEEQRRKPLTVEQKKELRALRKRKIDTSDIPEVIPARGEVIRGKDLWSPGPVDVKAIRAKLGLSQVVFAVRYGFKLRTVEDWESSGVQPPSHVRAYLMVIDRLPQQVASALKGAA